jgi:hypothetical protein
MVVALEEDRTGLAAADSTAALEVLHSLAGEGTGQAEAHHMVLVLEGEDIVGGGPAQADIAGSAAVDPNSVEEALAEGDMGNLLAADMANLFGVDTGSAGAVRNFAVADIRLAVDLDNMTSSKVLIKVPCRSTEMDQT